MSKLEQEIQPFFPTISMIKYITFGLKRRLRGLRLGIQKNIYRTLKSLDS